MDKPEKVEPGQVWRDRDQRSVGSGEFRVMDVHRRYALVYRQSSRRHTRIDLIRLLTGPYEYIGRSR